MAAGIWEVVLGGLVEALEPIQGAASEDGASGDGLKRLAMEIGFNLDGVLTPSQASTFATDISSVYSDLESIVQSPDGFAAQIPDLLKHLKSFTDTLNGLDTINVSLMGLGRGLFDYVVVSYLEGRSPSLCALLEFLDLIQRTPGGGAGGIPEYTRRRVVWDNFPKLVKPSDLFQTAYGWGQSTLNSNRLLSRLSDVLWAIGMPAIYVGGQTPGTDGAMKLMWSLELGPVSSQIGLDGHIAPATGALPGIALVPEGLASFDQTVPIPGGLQLEIKVGVSAASGYQLAIRPPGNVKLEPTGAGGPVTWSFSADLTLTRTQKDGARTVLFGQPDQTRITAQSAALTAHAGAAQDHGELGVEINAVDCRVTVVAGEGDGLLQKVLPSEMEIKFDFKLGWSTARGVYFNDAAGLEITIPVHASIGPILLDTVTLGLTAPKPGELDLVAAATGSLALGPIIATVDRVGLQAVLKPGPPLTLGFLFKPPNGVGLEVDASVVTGGGFLTHDEVKQEYDGILVLEIEDAVSVKAIAIITTGANNFSLMALIFVEDFTPIQLGLGFSLAGIGGMVGINRQADVAVLQAGLKTHLLDDILFPADPIKDAVRIIDNLKRAFPLAQGRILFGPMLQIGWGEPVALIFAELGLLIELPPPIRIILLGRIDALLPDPDAPVVELHLDVLGVVDFGASSLSLDATLHDSRVAAFAVAGDMALRLVWAGPGRTFLFAVGGFNKRFQPPPSFPKLDRVSISLATGDNPRLRLEAYMALTSNTAQVGAHLELYVVAGDFQVAGEMGFDALFQFQPFLFIIDMHAGIVLFVSGSPFMSLTLDGTLSGPTPWHVVGSASFHVLFFTVSVGVDVTIGQPAVEAGAPPPPIHDRLVTALKATNSWSAQVSPAKSLVVLRKIDPGGQILAHPLGTLGVHEQVVPLDLEIVRFGGVKLAAPQTFSIPATQVKVNGAVAAGVEPVNDYFATAQFKDLSDDEKLSRPSFEPYTSGLRITSETPKVGTARERDIVYQETIIDPGGTATTTPAPMAAGDFRAHRKPSGIARADSLGRRRFGGASRTIPVHDTRYVAATTDTLTRKDISGIGTGTTFTQALDALRRHTDVNSGDRGRLQVVAGHEVAP